ncbi:MAG: VanZ family protein [Clostridia bacterium]|nr:VanZ family protein [Clostridia bacterium]
MNILYNLFYYTYRLPLLETAIGIVLIGPVWGLMMRLLSRGSAGAVRVINTVLMLIALGGIAYITLLRGARGEREVILQPLQSFIEAKQQREMYRELLMNVLLFVPLGLTLPFALAPAGKVRLRHAGIALAAALVLSVAIESVQYAFALGRCETDDVLSNVVGTAFGVCACLIYCLLSNHRHD